MKLPTPTYTVDDPDGNHRYRIVDGNNVVEKLASVTGILGSIAKPALYAWYAKMACEQIESRLKAMVGSDVKLTDEWIAEVIAEGRKRPNVVRDEAAELGTAAHAAFEAILNGVEPTAPDAIKQTLTEFKTWFKSTDTEIVAQELPVASLKYHYGGRIDAIGYRDGKWGILDWKTSTGIYPEMAFQVGGGYAIAVEEQYGIKVEWADIVRFPKKEPWGTEVKPVKALPLARQGFLAALALTRLNNVESVLGEPTYSTIPKAVATAKMRKKAVKTVREATEKGTCPF